MRRQSGEQSLQAVESKEGEAGDSLGNGGIAVVGGHRADGTESRARKTAAHSSRALTA